MPFVKTFFDFAFVLSLIKENMLTKAITPNIPISAYFDANMPLSINSVERMREKGVGSRNLQQTAL